MESRAVAHADRTADPRRGRPARGAHAGAISPETLTRITEAAAVAAVEAFHRGGEEPPRVPRACRDERRTGAGVNALSRP